MATSSGLRLLLIRHGESFNNALQDKPGMTEELFQQERQVDPELSELGWRQARAVANFFANGFADCPLIAEALPVVALHVSPVKRALQTLQPLAERSGLRTEVWSDCFEVGGMYHHSGTEYRGMSRAEIQEQFPTYNVPADITEEGWYKLPGRESLEQAIERAEGIAQRLRRMAAKRPPDLPPGSIALLSHHDTMDLLVRALLKEDEEFTHGNCAFTRIDISPEGEATVRVHNWTGHLSSLDGEQPPPKL